MWAKILLLFFVFSFLFKTDHSFDQDLGRHLKLGEIIVKSGNVPGVNLFSYTNPDFPFINTHWMFEVLVYFSSLTIGLESLLILKIIIFLISVWLIFKITPKENQVLLLPVGFIFLHVLRERTELRPEILSFLFTALTLFILEKLLVLKQMSSDRGTFVSTTRTIFLLPLIQLIWINTHIYFFVGLALQVIFLVHMGSQNLRFHQNVPESGNKGGSIKLLGVILLLSVAVSLINPNGLTGFLYPLNVTKNYGYTIVENQTMFLLESINFRNPNFLFVKISLGFIILSIFIAFLRKRVEIKNILLAVSGMTLALMNVRSFPYLVFLSLPATLQNFGPIKDRFTKTLIFIFSGLLILESYFYLSGDYYRSKDDDSKPRLTLSESGKKALDFVVSHNLPNPIYNNFDIGSYIFYRGYPRYRVFVDGRPEAYPKEFFSQVYIPTQSDYSRFKNLEDKLEFKTIIFSITDQTPWGKAFLTSVTKDSDWKTVYIDDFIIILVKSDVLASQGLSLKDTPLDLFELNPASYQFDSYLSYLRLSLFLAQTGNPQSAQKFAERGLSLFPKSPLGNALFGINAKNKFFW